MDTHNQLLSSILNIVVYVCVCMCVCMYVCMYVYVCTVCMYVSMYVYVCMYVLQSYEEHETLRVTMKDGRAAPAKLLEGFKVVRARHLVSHIF